MTEIEQIKNNNSGELPKEGYDILRVKNIPNPLHELNIFKQTVTAFIENEDLDWEDPKWNEVLPKALVKFTEQLAEKDYRKDDLVTAIPNFINSLKEVKEWEWYSSKLVENGFEVYMKGIFRGIFLHMVHQQGIPHASLFIEREGKEYPTKALTDVLTYRKWNPETLELK